MHQGAHTDLSQIVAMELFQFSSYLGTERGTSLHVSPCALNPILVTTFLQFPVGGRCRSAAHSVLWLFHVAFTRRESIICMVSYTR